MKKIAIIPARQGSKRIPKKNIRDFSGKPVIAYSIKVAIESGIFDKVLVSTDSENIAEIAIKYGAEVPFFRSAENSRDEATTLDAVKEVLENCKNKLGEEFFYTCCIYATAPLIKPVHLQKGLQLMLKKSYSSVFPVIKYSHPVWRGFELINNEKTKILWPEFSNMNSQQLKSTYHDAGQWYWLDMNKISNSIFTDNSGAVVLKQTEAHDIDDIEDWKIAELKYNLQTQND